MSIAALSTVAAVSGPVPSGRGVPSDHASAINLPIGKPLPPLPSDVRPSMTRRSSARQAVSVLAISAKAAGKRTAPPPPHLVLCEGLRGILKEPNILTRLLHVLPWHTYHVLSSTCREFRGVLARAELRDVVLSEYVPGYRLCLGHASTDRAHLVDVDMSDLVSFELCQRVPLHQFPIHALKVLGSSLYDPRIPPNDPLTVLYVSLAHAHTRVVLLLQSLVHSGLAFTAEIDVDDYALTPPASGTPVQALSRLQELVFPKPLSFFDDQAAVDHLNQDEASARKRLRRAHDAYSSRTLPRASTDFQALMTKKSLATNPLRPVISAFGIGRGAPLPPANSNPPALTYYVGAWRRTLVDRRGGSKSYPVSDEDDDMVPRQVFPQRRSCSMDPSTISSAESSSKSSRSNSRPGTDSSSLGPKDTSSSSFSRDTASIYRPASSSPHDLSMATSRFRAPVLRVFVPCSELDEVSVSMCEEQLIQAGLWDHLSAGDIICNLGFIPSSEPSRSSQSSTSCEKSEGEHRRRWLIFNGYCLVHYIPPSPPPVENSLTLPSPFYYSHILPAYSDPRFVMSLPPLTGKNAGSYNSSSEGPFAQLTLSPVRSKVASPHSPLGYAFVKKYLWLARIPYVGRSSGTEAGAEIGEGWQGEWILEAEGTHEGKQHLLDAVKPNQDGRMRRGLWEIVKDKSGGGRIWIRLVVPNIDSNGPVFSTIPRT